MSEELRIRDNVRTVQVLRNAGFEYRSRLEGFVSHQESMKVGYFYHPIEDIYIARYPVAFLGNNGATLRLVNKDKQKFPQYHDQIRKLLQREGLIQK